MSVIPPTADDIDATWLNEALAECYPGVRVRGMDIIARQEWTNSHAWLRLDYDEAAGAPPTVFCKLPPADPGRRAAVIGTGMGLREARFYQRLASTFDLRIPACHAVRCDETGGDFILLLEDLDASGCTVSDGPTGVDPAAAADAVEAMAEMHVRFEDPARREREASWVPPPPASDNDYGTVMLRYGLDHHRERLSDQFAELAELYIDQRAATLSDVATP